MRAVNRTIRDVKRLFTAEIAENAEIKFGENFRWLEIAGSLLADFLVCSAISAVQMSSSIQLAVIPQ